MTDLLSVLTTLLSPGTFAIILVASTIGIILGAIPGLSGGLGVALLLPLTFGMTPVVGLAMLISIWIGGSPAAWSGRSCSGYRGRPRRSRPPSTDTR